jgi:hypothetical protein
MVIEELKTFHDTWTGDQGGCWRMVCRPLQAEKLWKNKGNEWAIRRREPVDGERKTLDLP